MFLAHFIRSIPLALKSLMLHKLRSALTMLGIVFGVFSVIAMLAIGEGASKQAQDQVLELGATNIICISVKPPQETSNPGQRRSDVVRYGLLRSDYELLTETLRKKIVKAVPIRELKKEARYRDRTMNVRLVGCTSDYLDVNRLSLRSSAGRFITDRDQQETANVAIIADEVAETLFPFEDPIGQTVIIKHLAQSDPYKIVGVTRHRTASAAIGGSLSGQDFNKDVYIPLKTMGSYIIFNDLDIQATSGSFSAEKVELNQITLQVADRKDVIPTAEFVRESLNLTHADKKDVAVIVPLELLKQADQLKMIFNIVLGSIAAISLVVGGIGIMNIMLATVTERTREIGIRRAMGAKQSDIIHQFLTETIVLSGTGGVAGVLLGLSTPFAFQGIRWIVNTFVLEGSASSSELGQIFSKMEPQIAVWSLPLAFGISVGIGIAFGLYPARSAARLDPIEALRRE
ncbi:MAG: ABC transporter permease [Planctomycetes bacterium]|nr:ABC transporter permease [Planctomycetota bacterium]